MRIDLCGVRGSTPAPGPDFVRYGGSTSCVGISRNDERPSLVLDAGTGMRQLSDLMDGDPFQGTILLTHLHWDHTHGLPFFPAGDREGSACHLLVPMQDNGASARQVIDRMLAPPHFPITFSQLRGNWSLDTVDEGTTTIEGWTVTARRVPHKGGTTHGYRIEGDGGSMAYIPDHGPIALGRGPDGLGEYHEAVMELADGVDVLLHDSQYTAAELPSRADFGHSAIEYALTLAEKTAVGRLVLFHHDPWRSDDAIDDIIRAHRDGPVRVQAAVEGTSIQI